MMPEQNAAQHRSGQVADAAQHRGGERLEPEQETHVVVRDAVIGHHHQAGDGRQRRADDECRRDDDVDVDAHQARNLRVLRGCAHRHPQARTLHDQHESAHQQRRQDHDQHLKVGHRRAEDVMRRRLDQRRKRPVVAAPDHQRDVLQHDRHADGRDQRREPRGAPQRPVGDLFHAVRDRHADEDRNEEPGENDHDRRKRGVRAEQAGDDRQRHHRAYHHHFAMREIDQADDAVDHRVAERNQRVDTAERETVDDLLQKGFHEANLPSRRGGPRLVADSPLWPTPRQSP